MSEHPPSTATVIAWACILLLAVVVVLLFFVKVPAENMSTLNLVLGAVLGSFGTVVAFYFGDSKSSQSKDEALQQIAKGP